MPRPDSLHAIQIVENQAMVERFVVVVLLLALGSRLLAVGAVHTDRDKRHLKSVVVLSAQSV